MHSVSLIYLRLQSRQKYFSLIPSPNGFYVTLGSHMFFWTSKAALQICLQFPLHMSSHEILRILVCYFSSLLQAPENRQPEWRHSTNAWWFDSIWFDSIQFDTNSVQWLWSEIVNQIIVPSAIISQELNKSCGGTHWFLHLFPHQFVSNALPFSSGK